MVTTGQVSFGGLDLPLSETSQSHIPIPRLHYQRKVTVTLTRTEAELVRALLMGGSVQESMAAYAAGKVGHGWTAKRATLRLKNAWRKLDRAITKRDEGQRRKENVADTRPVEGITEVDTPLF